MAGVYAYLRGKVAYDSGQVLELWRVGEGAWSRHTVQDLITGGTEQKKLPGDGRPEAITQGRFGG